MEHLVSLLRKNKLLAAALVVELAVVVWLAAGLFGPAYRLSLTPDTFSNDFPGFAALTEDGSALQIYNNNGFTSDKEITFSTAGVALPSGAYEVTVDYFSCQTPRRPHLQRAAECRFTDLCLRQSALRRPGRHADPGRRPPHRHHPGCGSVPAHGCRT